MYFIVMILEYIILIEHSVFVDNELSDFDVKALVSVGMEILFT